MDALVFHGPGDKKWESKPDPSLDASTDAIVRIDTTTICGTDLHIMKGDVPTVTEGRTLGHEAVGTVVATGDAVSNFAEDDHVLVSCISACGHCPYCRRAMYGQCLSGGGWILGNLIDGTQAEYVRVPFADNGLYKVPEGLTDEHVLKVADILPTGFEVGVLNGNVKPGDVVAVVGAGPVGLAAIMTSRLFGPSRIIAVDLSDRRLARAEQFGAGTTINPATVDAAERVRELTDGLGAEVVIEAVGVPATFELCTELVRPGGHVANIGVHGKPATLHLEDLWIKNVTITTGLVDTSSTPMLLRLIAEGRLDPLPLATHRYKLHEMLDAYETFGNAAETDALKMVLSAA
jgi:alcohol dehydrogenase